MLYLDSEGMGYTGPICLWQYAIDKGPVALHRVFYESIRSSLDLLEIFADQEICAWNLTHDWFHVVKMYNCLKRLSMVSDIDEPPNPLKLYEIERTNPCDWFIRPKAALDLMVYGTEGDYQFLKERRPITLHRMPRFLAYRIIQKLSNKIQYDSILFARYKKKESVGWEPVELSPPDPEFIDIRIKFNPSASLDAVGEFVVGRKKVEHDWSDFPQADAPGWRPYGGAWVDYAEDFIEYWNQPKTIEYAIRDVELLQEIHEAWGKPPAGHMNGELCINIANTRWKGFAIDVDTVKSTLKSSEETVASCPVNMNSPKAVKKYIIAPMDPLKAKIVQSTGKDALKVLANEDGEVGRRSKLMLEVRQAEAVRRVFEKLALAGRFHPNYMVQGALSDRMSGTGGLNAQGLHKKRRNIFTLVDPGSNWVLETGDFDAFETGIAAAVYKDERLIQELLRGEKPHVTLGAEIFGESYEDIEDTEKGRCGKCDGSGVVEPEEDGDLEFVPEEWAGSTKVTCYFCQGTGQVEDKYNKAKITYYASLYGAHEGKLSLITGKDQATMQKGMAAYRSRYPGLMAYQLQLERDYMPVSFDENNRLKWREPKRYIASLLGFKRYFNIEYDSARALFDLIQDWPKDWGELKKMVVRKHAKGEQKVSNAAMSSVIGALFSLCSGVRRQAGNHEIQSTGAGLTKRLQLRIWQTLQPVGIHEPRVSVFNTHDELTATCAPGVTCTPIVQGFIEEFRSIVQLLGMTWERGGTYWGDKHPKEAVKC